MNLQNKSWRTTGAGIAAILVAGGAALTALTDASPDTHPDWPALIAAVIAGVGLIFAKDSSKKAE
jgi:peptidoglycan/LPS O-acetylase OafA/YrhL